MEILFKIIFGIIAIIILVVLSPTVEDLTLDLRESGSFNCEDYTHATDATKSYNSTLDTNDFGCAITSLTTPLVILLVIVAVVVWILYGRLQEQQPMGYGSYTPGY